MHDAPRLLSIATAVPQHVLRQEDVRDWAGDLFGSTRGNMARLLPAFDNAGIDTRYSCVPLNWYGEDHGWRERNALYLEHATALAGEAATAALTRAEMAPREIDAVVMVSTSGIATPSLDALLINAIGLRADVTRLPVFGLGCAGGVLGLGRAAALAKARPGSRVLLVVVELCGLTFRRGDTSKSNVIATALFGDGAAAALVSTAGKGPRVTDWGDHTWPDTLGVMGWSVEDDGLGVLFSRDIPTIVEHEFRAAAEGYLARDGLGFGDMDGFICHPGGAKVVGALERVLGLDEGGLTETRAVLRDYGNMSAATVLFVLERVLTAGLADGRYLISALGPGFSAGFATLEAP